MSERRSSQVHDAARLCLEALDRSLAAAARLISGDTPPLCFCRSDARFANVIARPDGRLGLVDWEDSGLRDPARLADPRCALDVLGGRSADEAGFDSPHGDLFVHVVSMRPDSTLAYRWNSRSGT